MGVGMREMGAEVNVALIPSEVASVAPILSFLRRESGWMAGIAPE